MLWLQEDVMGSHSDAVLGHPPLLVEVIPGDLDISGTHGRSLPITPLADGINGGVNTGACGGGLLGHPVNGGQDFHTVRSLEALDELGDAVEVTCEHGICSDDVHGFLH